MTEPVKNKRRLIAVAVAAVIAAEAADLPEELLRIVTLLPPGDYTR